MTRRLLPLMLPTLLLAACGQSTSTLPTTTPTATTPTTAPTAPAQQAVGGVYQIQFNDVGSERPISSAQALEPGGLQAQGLTVIPGGPFTFTLETVQTFVTLSTQTRHIRATYLVTNNSRQTLRSPKFVAVVPTGSTTDTVFSSVRYFDGSDASSTSSRLTPVQGQTYDTATRRGVTDTGANAFLTGLDVGQVDTTGQGVKSLTQTGWQLADTLAGGASAQITFGVNVQMATAAEGGARKDPFSFSVNVLSVQEDRPVVALSSAVKQWDAASKTFGNYVKFPTLTYAQNGVTVTHSLPAYYDITNTDGSTGVRVLCAGDAKMSVTNISSAAFPNRWRVEVQSRGTHTLNVYAGTNCPTTAGTPLLSQTVTGVAPTTASPLAGGVYHSLALRADGTVQSWGYNNFGQLGDGTNTSRTTPVSVSGLTGITAIAGGDFHSLALRADGTVQSWGYNNFGQLGDGTNTSRTTPVSVSGLKDVTAIAGGGYHSLALRADGTVQSWGFNGEGQLGSPGIVLAYIPVSVSGLKDVTAIAGGGYHSLALRADGTVQSWGNNGEGQLGSPDIALAYIPVSVLGLKDVTAIAAGKQHSLALQTDGTVQSWGANASGQLGDGTTTNRTIRVRVSGLTDITAITGGGYHSLALRADGTVQSWGDNVNGQLGDGTTTTTTTPVKVSGFIGVAQPTP